MFQAKLKNKDINLLDVYKKKREPSKYTPIIKVMIFPLVAGIIAVSTFGYFTYSNYNLKEKNANITNQITKTDLENSSNPDLVKANNLSVIQSNTAKYKKLFENVESYPEINQMIFDQLLISAGVRIEITSLTYTMESSIVTLQIEAPSANDAELFVRRLKETNKFANIQYTGYSQVEKNMLDAVTDLDKVISGEKKTYKAYTATVLCMMK